MSAADTAGADMPPAAKDDPETLVLRARPPGAIRFKRGVIVGVAGIAATVVVGAAWFALEPRTFQLVQPDDDLARAGKAPSDAISALPGSYGDVPQLGPPLPGDLGRPILERQRDMIADPAGVSGDAQAPADEQARQKAALEAARQSGVLVTTRDRAETPAVAAMPAAADGEAPSKLPLDPERDPNAQQRKNDFARAHDNSATTNPYALEAAPSPYTLAAGSVISAGLITGLRSDLPGLVTAQVTEQVYDTVSGRIVLIPQGARLIGSYDSVVAFGQRRALVVWQRLVLPDGRSLRFDNVPATDPSGYAGLADKIDFHTWSLLKGVALATLLGVGSSLTLSHESDLVEAIRQSTQQNATRAGDQITSRNLQIQPTITIRPGTPVRLVVHRDLVLAPWKD